MAPLLLMNLLTKFWRLLLCSFLYKCQEEEDLFQKFLRFRLHLYMIKSDKVSYLPISKSNNYLPFTITFCSSMFFDIFLLMISLIKFFPYLCVSITIAFICWFFEMILYLCIVRFKMAMHMACSSFQLNVIEQNSSIPQRSFSFLKL